MITEDVVVRAVAQYLTELGYRDITTCSTMQRGVDIEATHPTRDRKILVEAKGGTSSKATTNRFGRPFTPNQARSHVAVALLKALQLRQTSADHQVALALPDDEDHTKLVASVGDALAALGLVVFFVAENREVRLLGGLD